MEKRIGFIGIIVEDKSSVKEMNELLGEYGHLLEFQTTVGASPVVKRRTIA